MGSARSKSAVSSRWQKYCARKSSGRQTMLRPGTRGFAHAVGGFVEVGVGVGRAGHLHQANAVFQSSRHVVSIFSLSS